jgi:uncharacterized membrane protein YphA (DoxX/SURF4 family)
MRILGILARVALGLIFLAAAAGKIVDPAALAKIIHNYRILPDMLVNVAALSLPWVEMVVAACLLTDFASRGASLTATVLLAVFVAAMAYAYSKGYDTQCGCFTTKADDAISPASFVRDGGMLLLAALVTVDSFIRARDA